MQARARKEKVPVTRLLLSEGMVRRKQLGASLERYYQVPFMPYEPTVRVPLPLLKGISRSYLRNQCWVPVSLDEDEVVVLMANPMDAHRVMDIQRTLKVRNYVFRVGIEDDIRHFIDEIDKPVKSAQLGEMVEVLREEGEEEGEEGEETAETTASVIQTVNQMILDAHDARASDIHIEPGRGGTPATVRIRVDGLCQPLITLPAAQVQAVISRIKIISDLDISERRKPQDGKCRLRHGDLDLELRVATIPTVNGENVILRLLPAREPMPMKQLSLSERNLMEIVRLVNRPHGLFLVVGPTGSGKTTTLHAILGYLNRPERKIWTAEDPVEITQSGLQQVQVRPDLGLTFSNALRAFLRADPDVIMVGEMRDRETAAMAVDASLTGHLVFSTLHTNSAAETVVRLLDLGLDPVSFADALSGVLAQRLIRTLCEGCKQASTLDEATHDMVRVYYGEEHFSELKLRPGEQKLCQPVSCPACSSTGYRSRVGIHELLVNSEELKKVIYAKGRATEIREVAMKQGMRTLMQDGIRKMINGQTDLEEVRRVALA